VAPFQCFLFACVCVRERERERERGRSIERRRKRLFPCEKVMCVQERRDVCVCVCGIEEEFMSVCMYVRKRVCEGVLVYKEGK
jgi:hypothetical protein